MTLRMQLHELVEYDIVFVDRRCNTVQSIAESQAWTLPFEWPQAQSRELLKRPLSAPVFLFFNSATFALQRLSSPWLQTCTCMQRARQGQKTCLLFRPVHQPQTRTNVQRSVLGTILSFYTVLKDVHEALVHMTKLFLPCTNNLVLSCHRQQHGQPEPPGSINAK